MKRLLVLLMILSVGITASCQQWLSTNYPRSILDNIIPSPTSYAPIPSAKKQFWKEIVSQTMRDDYIKMGEKYINIEWHTIPDDVFAEYKTNGNRSNYENKSFELRKQLTGLAMAEIMEQQGRFMKDIINGLHYFISETWWGIPAHYPVAKPEKKTQVVDLFNAETANLLAWTIYMLHDDLETEEKGICRKIRKEIDRRMLTPARTIDYSWKEKTNNWNPWICSNWLTCVLLCEENRQHQIDAIVQILQCLDTFYDAYADDGGCDEGIGYWDRAAGSFYECLELLGLATNGTISMAKDLKLKNMGAFVYNTYIGHNTFVNFADAKPTTSIHPNIALPFGIYTNDSILIRYALRTAKNQHFEKRPSSLFQHSGNYPTLSRELLFLSKYKTIKDVKPAEPLLRDTWMPHLQIMTAHSQGNTIMGLFVAAKGGHNGETHNHNDVGNFIIYDNARPVIIDIGVGTYTAQTFSKQRYELFNCRSAYHNVPLINGTEQQEGTSYKSEHIEYHNEDSVATFSLDIARAYPKEAAVRKWERTIVLNRGKNVTITENYELSNYQQPSQMVLLCCEEPQQTGAGVISIGDKHKIQFDDKQLHASIEKIVYDDAIVRKTWKNNDLYRIILTIQSRETKERISYTIQ